MALCLHTPVNQAHIEDLKNRGTASEEDTAEVFRAFRVPSFSFESWLADMVEEGVYLETAF